MSRRLNVSKLPEDVRLALEKRIRGALFQGLDEHVEWLKERGISLSRTSLWLFMTRLRDIAIAQGDKAAMIAATPKAASESLDRLLAELGRLRLQELELVERIRNASTAAISAKRDQIRKQATKVRAGLRKKAKKAAKVHLV